MLGIVSDNPILIREMRRRMRGKAMIYSLIAYVGTLCVVTFFILMMRWAVLLNQVDGTAAHFEEMNETGQSVFFGMLVIQVILVLILAPAITASLITSERERQTADFLRVTTLPPSHFIVGSFLSTILYVILLLGCTLPIVSTTLLFGGIAIDEILLNFGALLISSILLSSLGIYCSSINEKTRTSQGIMLGIAIVFVILAFYAGDIHAGLYLAFQQTQEEFGQGAVPMFAMTIPDWIFAAFPPLLFSFFMLLVAGRKVYNFENRPLNYKQYFTLNFIIWLTMAGLFWPVATKSTPAAIYTWVLVSMVLMLVGAVILNIHQIEVGTDNWHIHQKIKPLAIFDDGIIFFILFLVCWWLFGGWYFDMKGSLYARMFNIAATVTVPPFLFLAVISRAASHFFYKRQSCFRLLAVSISILWLILPLIFVLSMGATSLAKSGGFLSEAVAFSPLYAIIQLATLSLETQSSNGFNPGLFAPWPGQFAAAVYLVGSIVGYVYVVQKNYKWKKELDVLLTQSEITNNIESREVFIHPDITEIVE